MPSTQHTPPPPDHEQPPCDCGGCLEFRTIHYRLSPELPLRERLAKRANDIAAQRRYYETDDHQPTRQAA